MNYPLVHFTFLAFQLNALIDVGDHLDPDDVRRHCEDEDLLDWLPTAIDPNRLDLSLYHEQDDRDTIHEFFAGLTNAVDSRRKFGITPNNGLALLLAYCLEGAQQAGGATGTPGEWP